MTAFFLLLFQISRLDLFYDFTAKASAYSWSELTSPIIKRIDVAQKLSRPECLVIDNISADGFNYQAVTDNILELLNSLNISSTLTLPDAAADIEDYSRYDFILLTSAERAGSLIFPGIAQYVKEGGKLVCFANGVENSMSQSLDAYRKAPAFTAGEFLGILDTGPVRETNSVFFFEELISGITGKLELTGDKLSPQNYFNYTEFELSDNCQILMEAADGNPLVWQTSRQNGTIMVINTGKYEKKQMRGLMAGCFSAMLGTVVYQIPCSSTYFIDDFPADYRAELPDLRTMYGRDYERYVQEIWWPLMLSQIRKYEIRCNGAAVCSYSDLSNFSDSGSENQYTCLMPEKNTKRLMIDLLSTGGEICLHGLNHQPLSCNQPLMAELGFEAWNDCSSAVDSLSAACEYLDQLLPGYPIQAYIPASDILDFEPESLFNNQFAGLLTDIRVISGLYFEPYSIETKSADFLVQEIGRISDCTEQTGLYDKQLIALPRISSGTSLSDDSKFLIASSVTVEGLNSHTIFVDDILDPVRRQGNNAEQIIGDYGSIFSWVKTEFEWLNDKTATQTAAAIDRTEQTRLYWRTGNGQLDIICDYFTGPFQAIIFSQSQLEAAKGCQVERIDSLRWLVNIEQQQCVLMLKNEVEVAP
jgi:hypothetical protein